MFDYFNKINRDRLEQIPSLGNLAKIIQERDSFDIKGLQKEMEKMIKNNFVTSFLDYELHKFNNNSNYFPPASSFSSINLIDCKTVTLNLMSLLDVDYSSKKKSNAYSSDIILTSLSQKNINFDLFEQSSPYPLDILDISKKIKFKKNISLKFSESIFLGKQRDIAKFSPNKGNDSFFFLMLISKEEAPFVWEYTNDGIPQRLISGNKQSSRLEHTCDLLGKIGCLDSIPVLEKFIEHDNFNVRWEAVKSIMSISTDRGVTVLKNLVNDKHPHIRKAAKNSLERILK